MDPGAGAAGWGCVVSTGLSGTKCSSVGKVNGCTTDPGEYLVVGPARPARLRKDTPTEKLKHSLANLRRFRFHPGHAIVVQTPGAGGYGSSEERTREARRADAESSKFSGEFLQEHYPE